MGGISFKGHYPRGRWARLWGYYWWNHCGPRHKSLHDLVEELLAEVGPGLYERTDLRLNAPVAKATRWTDFPDQQAPAEIGDQKVAQIKPMWMASSTHGR